MDPVPERARTRGLRIPAWIAGVLLLLLPAVAMQFTSEVDWSAGDFAVAGLLIFGSLGAYEVAARKSADLRYRGGIGLAVLATFLLVWANAAVGITDSVLDSLYLAVAGGGILGIAVALFRPRGGALAMLAAALALAGLGTFSLLAGEVPEGRVLVVYGFIGAVTALFVTAAYLLRLAARKPPSRSPRSLGG